MRLHPDVPTPEEADATRVRRADALDLTAGYQEVARAQTEVAWWQHQQDRITEGDAMPEYTAAQKAQVKRAVKDATKGVRRSRRNKYEKVADALGDVADDFRGFDRDDISHVIELLNERAHEEE